MSSKGNHALQVEADGGCKNATLGIEICVHHTDFRSDYTFSQEMRFFFYLYQTIKICLRKRVYV